MLFFFCCIFSMWMLVMSVRPVARNIFSYRDLFAWGLNGKSAQLENWSLPGGIIFALTGIDLDYLPAILERGLPSVLIETEKAVAAQSLSFETGERPLWDGESQGERDAKKNKQVQAAIYHTHNAETYVPLHGKSKVDGENGGVSLVGNEIARVLEEAGIKTVHDLTIHDYPDFPTSYIKAESTAARLVRENTSLRVLLDIHRDAGVPVKETVKVGDENAARIIFIVGNGERLPNPHWRENYAFAQMIAHRLEQEYPGVLKGVRIKSGRYNQHVSPHALLVEIGSEKNTLEEALTAARCLAYVLAAVIQEEDAGALR